MKKKIVKPLVIAASVAAIAGIGAVSFAAWSGNSNSNVTSSGNNTGNITMIGFTGTPTLANIEGLLPYNQGSGKTIGSVQLPAYEANEAYTITVTTTSSLTLYVNVGAEITTAPSATTAEGWKAITAATFDFTVTAAGTTETVNDKYLNIILDSSVSTDMNQTFDITVTLAKKAA